MRLLNFTLQKGTLEAEPSEVFLATPVASASDNLGVIITTHPAVLYQLEFPTSLKFTYSTLKSRIRDTPTL